MMINAKDAAGEAGQTVKEGIAEAKPVAKDAQAMADMAKEDVKAKK